MKLNKSFSFNRKYEQKSEFEKNLNTTEWNCSSRWIFQTQNAPIKCLLWCIKVKNKSFIESAANAFQIIAILKWKIEGKVRKYVRIWNQTFYFLVMKTSKTESVKYWIVDFLCIHQKSVNMTKLNLNLITIVNFNFKYAFKVLIFLHFINTILKEFKFFKMMKIA